MNTNPKNMMSGLANLLETIFSAYSIKIRTSKLILDVDAGVTATSGGTQSDGYKITKPITIADTVAAGNDSLTLPLEKTSGATYIVKNNTASNDAKVYPPVGGTIDLLSANAGLAIGANDSAMFILRSYNPSSGATTWNSVFTD